jgi:hypothetical protein
MWLGKRTAVPKAGLRKGRKQHECTEDTLWKWFSRYIRLRDSDSIGYCKCVTCHRRAHWKEMDAGHLVSRRWKAVKYDERNVHAQCKSCNRFNAGEQLKMSHYIDKKYGSGTAKMLSDISRCKVKFDKMWFKAKADNYRIKAKELAEEKGQKI